MPDFRAPKRGPGEKIGQKKACRRSLIFLNNMEFQSGMRAATANVNVHAIVYFIDFLNLKKITFIENKTSTQPFLWKEQETETRLCCKEIWQEYGTFLRDIQYCLAKNVDYGKK